MNHDDYMNRSRSGDLTVEDFPHNRRLVGDELAKAVEHWNDLAKNGNVNPMTSEVWHPGNIELARLADEEEMNGVGC